MFSHGLLWSVRFALLDGPSLVLTSLAVLASERGRYLLSAAIAGVNTLGRETNILGGLAQPLPVGSPDRAEADARRWWSSRYWLRLAMAIVLLVLPLLIWEDYLRSIYRSTIFAGGGDQVTMPLVALIATAGRVLSTARTAGPFGSAGLELCIVLSIVIQGVYLAVRRHYHAPWWRVAAGYAVLMLLIDRVLWDPTTGAITRVMLPMTVGFNILLLRETRAARFWPWFVAGNLHIIPTFWVMPLF
jgi:hypothetical protein